MQAFWVKPAPTARPGSDCCWLAKAPFIVGRPQSESLTPACEQGQMTVLRLWVFW